MNKIKETIANALYYHISLLVMIGIVLGAIGAGVVIALFAFRTPIPDSASEVSTGQQIRVAKSVLDHISLYAEQKAKDGKTIPSVGGAVFYIPPKTQ